MDFLGGVRVSVRVLRGVRVRALGISKVIKIRTPLTTPGPIGMAPPNAKFRISPE